MSMSTGPLSSAVNSAANAFPIGKKGEVKDKDIKKEDITQAQKPAIDQKDTLQSTPVKSDSLKTPQKFPDKPSMGTEGKPPKDAQISQGQKPQPQMGTEGKPPKDAQISQGQKPQPQMGTEGKPPKDAQISQGQKPQPQMGTEGKPPKDAQISQGQKPQPQMGTEGKPPKDAQITTKPQPQMGTEGKPPKTHKFTGTKAATSNGYRRQASQRRTN